MRAHLLRLALGSVLAPGVAAQEVEKLLLSEEIRAALERDGAEAAERRFDEIYPSQKDRYEIDVKGLAELATEYLQAGDQVTAQAILNMTGTITRNMIATHQAAMPAGANPPRPDPGRQRDAPGPEPPMPVRDRGPSRDDLQRFHGLYGVSEPPGARRDLFVTESCDGYLVVGATWGDAANWWMRSVSDHEFAMTDAFRSLRIEFEIGPDGTARSVHHDLEGLPTPLPRVGPLPEGWEACIPREDD